MLRFLRLTFALFGVTLFAAAVVQYLRPTQAEEMYTVIYGDRPGGECCAVYLINESQARANRVQIGTVPQPVDTSPISPSGEWRFLNLDTPQGFRPYFQEMNEGQPVEAGRLIRLADIVSQNWMSQWSLDEDKLLFLRRASRFESAYFEVSPDDPQPQRLSDYIFGGVRSMHEQSLPITDGFFPWVLILIALNLLVVAGGIKYHERHVF